MVWAWYLRLNLIVLRRSKYTNGPDITEFPYGPYIVEDYAAMDNDDPDTKAAYPYMVAKAVASITDGDETIYFATMEKAVQAAGTTKTITLLQDATFKMKSGQKVTINKNGHKLTLNKPGSSYTIKPDPSKSSATQDVTYECKYSGSSGGGTTYYSFKASAGTGGSVSPTSGSYASGTSVTVIGGSVLHAF